MHLEESVHEAEVLRDFVEGMVARTESFSPLGPWQLRLIRRRGTAILEETVLC